jgi:hypothetical protein
MMPTPAATAKKPTLKLNLGGPSAAERAKSPEQWI